MASPIPNAKPFVKGDKRINRKGRPKSFDQLRKLALQLAHETTETKQGEMSAVEIILRQMMQDKKQRETFLQYAYGKVPDELNVKQSGKITVKLVWPEDETDK